ncbi:hypothetical protein [Steroidobacter cummioxidans]|uniref:hypothetical protein n=1 Tax=Steroidobacter cummioxidans TaxID=1803913 RepID=UPI000E320D25|nr:hypothetical protein [Steroidobacter cummioxidans]
MLDTTSWFHKICVIESQHDGELRIGRKLVDGALFVATLKRPELKVEYRNPRSKEELFRVLDLIENEAREQGIYPMLHFECHGCPDGLELGNGDLVGWDSLRDILISINRACRSNLVIAVAACDGAHLIKAATRLERAPFWALIGTEGAIAAGALMDDFDAFYTTLFESLDGDAALAALNRGIRGDSRRYKFLTAAGLFVRAYRRYHERYCIGKGRRARIEDLVSQAMERQTIRRMGIGAVRKLVKQQLSQEEMYFEAKKRKFFFADEFPENEARCSFTREQVLGTGT